MCDTWSRLDADFDAIIGGLEVVAGTSASSPVDAAGCQRAGLRPGNDPNPVARTARHPAEAGTELVADTGRGAGGGCSQCPPAGSLMPAACDGKEPAGQGGGRPAGSAPAQGRKIAREREG